MAVPSSLFGLALRLMRARSLDELAPTLVADLVASALAGGAQWQPSPGSATRPAQRGLRQGVTRRYAVADAGELRVINPADALDDVAFAALLEAFSDQVAHWSGHASAGASPSPMDPRRDGPVPLRSSARVLVVDDVPVLRQLLQSQLTLLGYEADLAADGAAALARWRAGRHALVLTDLNMPVMDGIGLVRAIREAEAGADARTTVIAVTAAAEAAELQRCRDAGMDDTLTKPLQIEALARALSRWMPGGRREAPAADAQAEAEDIASGELPVFSLAALTGNFGPLPEGDHRAMVAMFLHSAREGLFHLQAWGMGTAELVAEMHRQKSAARTVGALRYGDMAAALEARVKAGRWDPEEDVLTPMMVALLAVEDAVGDLAAPGAREDSPGVPAVAPVWQRCLVVDDDPVVREQLRRVLSAMGIPRVHVADGGDAALESLQDADGWDLLICDLQMPDLDGVEVLRRLADTGFHGAVVMLSGAQADVLQTAGNLAGMYGNRVIGVLEKPVTAVQLAAVLARAHAIPVPASAQHTAPITAADIEAAIAADEFSVVFQPQVDSHTAAPAGAEALARWRRADGSWVSPAQFIEVAEQVGLIGTLSERLLQKTLAGIRTLRDAGHRLKIGFNLSALWIEEVDLPERIATAVAAAGLVPSDIGFEITETGLTRDVAKALDVLTRLRLRGFTLSLDDFGVGYASFEQLRRFPITEIKLDRQFVADAGHDPAARAIIESMLDIARRLSLGTVAEGVETEADLQLVRTLGCPKVQGYYFARPMAVGDLLAWLATPRGVLRPTSVAG